MPIDRHSIDSNSLSAQLGVVMAGGWRLYEYYEQKYQEEQRRLPWYRRDRLWNIAGLVLLGLFFLLLFYLKIAQIV